MERFKQIEGYDDYMISNYGRVYNKYFDRYLKPGFISKNSKYQRVVLTKDRKPTYHLIHRLVAEAFCHKPEGMNIVHHIDNDPTNNHYTNLKWCNQSYNVKQAYADGLIPDRSGQNNPNYRHGRLCKKK